MMHLAVDVNTVSLHSLQVNRSDTKAGTVLILHVWLRLTTSPDVQAMYKQNTTKCVSFETYIWNVCSRTLFRVNAPLAVHDTVEKAEKDCMKKILSCFVLGLVS